MKALLFANTDWYLYNFRLSLAEALRQEGYDVLLLSPPGEYVSRLEEAGFRWASFPLSRRSMNPLRELLTIYRLWKLYRVEKPDVLHHFTIKCVLYGTMAGLLTGRKPGIINSITGLGYIFVNPNPVIRVLRMLIQFLYRLLLRQTQVIFQNPEDYALFIEQKIVTQENSALILGSGVDTVRFRPLPEPDGPAVVALVGRLLWDKGVGEFAEAARLLKERGVAARMVLIGRSDPANPTAVPQAQIECWVEEGIVEWWGWQDDMVSVFARAHIICLPSYREGMPKVLAEAGACGRPIVAADAPGCREIVRHGVNGLLVPPRDARALADALVGLIQDPHLRAEMGRQGRKMVEEDFSLAQVIEQTLAVYARLGKIEDAG